VDDDRRTTATVLVSNRQDAPVDEDALTRLAEDVLAGEGVRAYELSVSLVGPPEMEDLHLRYLGEPGPTDVLSFPLDENQEDGVRLLGDVVICPACAASANPDLGQEVGLLLVHGILHLLGYDHEEDGDRAVMWARQKRYSGVAVDESGTGREAAR
jgi:probable rRNA maturation factor